jgi:hypothetical protein
METRCKAGELAVVSRPLRETGCTKHLVGRVVQVVSIDLLMTLFSGEGPVWTLNEPMPCPVEGCGEQWWRYADRCLRPLRDKPPAGEHDVFSVQRRENEISERTI